MFDTLPASALEFSRWTWDQIAPYYSELHARPLTGATVDTWLSDWSRLGALLDETNVRLYVATTVNTADA
ncbi:MAG TPA: peptidase M3, partial [Ktedonobacterales bacterium]|nr:peptidase M3 [Ktedonobacterales bacterium]